MFKKKGRENFDSNQTKKVFAVVFWWQNSSRFKKLPPSTQILTAIAYVFRCDNIYGDNKILVYKQHCLLYCSQLLSIYENIYYLQIYPTNVFLFVIQKAFETRRYVANASVKICCHWENFEAVSPEQKPQSSRQPHCLECFPLVICISPWLFTLSVLHGHPALLGT